MNPDNHFPSVYDPNYDDQGHDIQTAIYYQNRAPFQQPEDDTHGQNQFQQHTPHASQPHRGSMANGYTYTSSLTQPQLQGIDQGHNYTFGDRGFSQTTDLSVPSRTIPRHAPSVSSGGYRAPPSDITGTPDYTRAREPLTKNYFRRSPEFFVNGRVFLVLWSEPAGQVFGTDTKEITKANFDGEYVHNQTRRFVVIARKQRHALCVPITTYGGRATTKEGIDTNTHAVIYTSHDPPQLLPGESLLKDAIKVRPEEQNLKSASRVNFEKIYTVEYNIKVALVGRVAQAHINRLQSYAREALDFP